MRLGSARGGCGRCRLWLSPHGVSVLQGALLWHQTAVAHECGGPREPAEFVRLRLKHHCGTNQDATGGRAACRAPPRCLNSDGYRRRLAMPLALEIRRPDLLRDGHRRPGLTGIAKAPTAGTRLDEVVLPQEFRGVLRVGQVRLERRRRRIRSSFRGAPTPLTVARLSSGGVACGQECGRRVWSSSLSSPEGLRPVRATCSRLASPIAPSSRAGSWCMGAGRRSARSLHPFWRNRFTITSSMPSRSIHDPGLPCAGREARANPAVTHRDGSGRLQTVSRRTNRSYWS